MGSAFQAKVLLLILGNKVKLISCCNEEWLELNFFFKTMIVDFFWRISSCNIVNWHCLYVKGALTDWMPTQKLKKTL